MEPLHDDVKQIRNEMVTKQELEEGLAGIKTQMVTKSYFDDKLGDLSGDLVVKLRKEDAKVDRLADILRRKEVIDDSDLKQLSEYRIFPKLNTEGH